MVRTCKDRCAGDNVLVDHRNRGNRPIVAQFGTGFRSAMRKQSSSRLTGRSVRLFKVSRVHPRLQHGTNMWCN
jgi:hypothetical protein